jgi:hypothetical protein
MEPRESLNTIIYTKYPPKEERVIGENRFNKNGVLSKWNGKNYVPVYQKKTTVPPKIKKCDCNPSKTPKNMVYPRLPRVETDRIIGKRYSNTKNEIVIWNGKLVNCEHNKQKHVCGICKPLSLFAHKKKVKMNSELNKHIKNKKRNLEKYLPDFGLTLGELIKFLEKQFSPGMGWHNRSKWHIDHRKPIISFDLSLPNEIEQCFHYTNLQPLWGPVNSSKGKKYDENTFGWEWIVPTGWMEKKSDTPIQIENDPDRSITFIPEPEEVDQSYVQVLNENEQDHPVPVEEEVIVPVLNENAQDRTVPAQEEVAVPVLNENEQDRPVPVQEEVAKPCMQFRIENVHGNCSVSYTFTSEGGEKSCVTVHFENVQGNCSGSFNINAK